MKTVKGINYIGSEYKNGMSTKMYKCGHMIINVDSCHDYINGDEHIIISFDRCFGRKISEEFIGKFVEFLGISTSANNRVCANVVECRVA